jgi:hypothetical protein
MIELGMIRDIVTIFGVIAGFSYYVLTVRNANITRKQMIARQLTQDLQSLETSMIYIELLEMEWDDYDDYLSKYDSSVNRDNFAKRSAMLARYNSIGYDLYRGNIDIETVYNIITYQGVWLYWSKFKPIILEYRKRYAYPDYAKWFEYLVDELAKERMRQGLPVVLTDVDGYARN